jgi:hypothetical protein
VSRRRRRGWVSGSETTMSDSSDTPATSDPLPQAPLSIGLLLGSLVAAYLILGPAIFMGPLLPFRTGMLRNKAQLMSKVAQRLRIKLDDLYARMASGEITAEDEESIQRLRRLNAVIDELPIWPFDAPTLRKFLTAYVLPIVSSFGLSVVKVLVDYFKIGAP